MFNRPPPIEASTALSLDQQQLLRLNVDFLKLLISVGQTSPASGQGRHPQLCLPNSQAIALEQCRETALRQMAACGFSLFCLSLHQEERWQRVAAHSLQQVNVQHYSVSATMTAHHDELSHVCMGFMECALFFAWHLAQQEPQHARLLLGMSADCAAIVARLELWQCRYIAHRHSKLLSCRWRHHPYFWPDLLRHGRSGDPQHFKFACLLGSQLMAQELEPNAILHLSKTEAD